MKLLPITYKIVRDLEGTTMGVEIWQGAEHITVSLEAFGQTKQGYTWNELKEAVENLQQRNIKELQSYVTEGMRIKPTYE
jgi:hypothetical protein